MTFGSRVDFRPRVLVTRGLDAVEPWVDRLADSLRPVEVEVVPVASASRALQRLGSCRPRVVVLDEPSLMDVGWSLLRQIQRVHAGLPCLMVVSRAEPMLLSRALQLSAYSVFGLPVDVGLMGKMVCRLLEK